MRLELHCLRCKKTLTGGLDTFGDTGEEKCLECWLKSLSDGVTDELGRPYLIDLDGAKTYALSVHPKFERR